MRHIRAIALIGLGLLGGCTLLAVGAAAALAAGGTYVYLNGELESSEEASLDATYGATLEAVEALEFELRSKKKDALSAVVVGERANGDKVTIRLDGVEEDMTKVRIRVGTIGDEEVSRRMLGAIREAM